jgi:23S rRNA G2445 N2-methylase RlmL
LNATYLATVLAGLEPVAASEIRAKVSDAAIQETWRGKVLFRSGQSVAHLLRLRTIDDLFVLIERFPQGPHRMHLAELERAVARLDTDKALHVAAWLPRGRPTVFVNASRAGKQTYSRFEAADAALRGLLARNPRWRAGTAEVHDLEFRLDVAGEEALFSLRLSPPGFRYRGEERAFTQAALRPPVAHALVWLSEPNPRDFFLDPFCGSGTILAERAAYAAREIAGGDLSPEVLAVARANLARSPHPSPLPGGEGGSRSLGSRSGEAAWLMQWDARRLPFRGGTIDKIVSNPPFGHQVLAESEIGPLYERFASELARVLAPGGWAILLTDQAAALRRAAARASLHVEPLAAVSLKGLHPQIWRLAAGPRPQRVLARAGALGTIPPSRERC